jgi:hypothetical protein
MKAAAFEYIFFFLVVPGSNVFFYNDYTFSPVSSKQNYLSGAGIKLAVLGSLLLLRYLRVQ